MHRTNLTVKRDRESAVSNRRDEISLIDQRLVGGVRSQQRNSLYYYLSLPMPALIYS